jgi:hypothetical protein
MRSSRHLLLHLLSVWALAGCGEPEPPRWPTVATAPRVSMDTFRRAAPVYDGLACWALSPAGDPVVIRIMRGRITFDGRGVGTYSLTAVSPTTNHLIDPLYDALLDTREDHLEAIARHPCAPNSLSYLVEADADVPGGVLRAVMRSAASAGYDQAWLRVQGARAWSGQPWSAPGGGCRQHWALEIRTDGAMALTRTGDDTRVLPTSGGAVDTDAAMALLSSPEWAWTTVAVVPDFDTSVQQVATVFADLPARLPDRLTVALLGWGYGWPRTSDDGGIQAIPIEFGGPPGECLFDSPELTCEGLDGRRHAWVGDPCWNRTPRASPPAPAPSPDG